MGDARHPKDYNDGPRKQMTRAWKLRVQSKLAENKAAGVEPSTVAALARLIKADKVGLYRTLETESDDPDWREQTVSSYVDAICDVLCIEPPMQESSPVDDELERELDKLRKLPADKQAALLAFIRDFLK